MNVIESMVPPQEELKSIGPIFDAQTYLRTGAHSIGNLKKFAYLKEEDNVLDIGCGYGRVAIQLTQFLKPQSIYAGLDNVSKHINWCSDHISSKYENFKFIHLDVYNKMYNPSGAMQANCIEFPQELEGKFDLAILFSVFTHMFPSDVKRYLQQIQKCLKPGGRLFSSFFIINEDRIASMKEGKSQFQFVKQDGYYAHNLNVHEGAVAYDESRVAEMMWDAGFERDKLIFGNWSGRQRAESGQDLVVCVKRR